ncbi:cytochrome c [Solibacillus sp. CAU 1738]|uniref:c-type cytochrome n=1 Tax=Solibacillus sp. CAU 1738 TaxID=3140363 RepID=UPI0032609CD8
MGSSKGLFRIFVAVVAGVIILLALIYYSYVVTDGILKNHNDEEKNTAVFSLSEFEAKQQKVYDLGESIFNANCLACHGNLGANGQNGPNLQLSEFAEKYNNVVDRVTNGGTSMPAFESVLSKEEIDAIAKYITEIIAKADE